MLSLANGCSDQSGNNGSSAVPEHASAPELSVHDSGRAPTPSANDPADPLADAPADWAAFLEWAERKLETPTADMPPPDAPRFGVPSAPVIHLADLTTFQAAIKSCDWKPAKFPAAAITQIGPFRSDQPPGANFKVQSAGRSTADGRESLSLVMSGFQVRREQVGGIELTLRIPFGKYFCLVWSTIGRAYVPIESHDEAFTVRIPTDDFVEWSGALEKLSLQTDGAGDGIVEIRQVRFLPRERSYVLPFAVRPIRLGEDIRAGVYSHCPADIRYENVAIPERARLRVGLGCVSETAGGVSNLAGAAEFQIAVIDGNETAVLERRIEPRAAWDEASIEMGRWSGKTVTIVLRSRSSDPDTVAFWGVPTIYAPIERPELLVVYLIDTVSAEHVGLYGYARDTMPRLAAKAREGVWFANMFSNSPRTIESIPDLMLSMPTERHGVHHSSTPAPEALVTLAEALRAGGCATASFCTNVNAGFRQGMAQGFDTFIDKIFSQKSDDDRTIPLPQVMDWIGRHRDRPMFIYVHTAEPHSPYIPLPGYAGRYDPEYHGVIDGVNFQQAKAPRDVAHVRALYDEEIYYADARLGMFLDALADTGLLDASTFFVTSDHGEEFLEHNSWEHGRDLHNENTRVPLAAFGRAITARGRVDAPAQLFDIMPTILDLYKLPAPYDLEGESLLPLLQSSTNQPVEPDPSRRIFASNHNYRIDYKLFEYSMIADGRWKLMLGAAGSTTSRFMLFDLRQDPRERRDLLTADTALSRRLIEELIRWRVAQHVYAPEERGPTLIDPAAMQDLRALGYLGEEEKEEK